MEKHPFGADLTAHIEIWISRDEKWEIEVDGLRVVWTQDEESSSSECSDTHFYDGKIEDSEREGLEIVGVEDEQTAVEETVFEEVDSTTTKSLSLESALSDAGKQNCSDLVISTSDAETFEIPPSSPFAEHPTCVRLREARHFYGDQVYLELPELLSDPWRKLVYWHGRCREGRPTLIVLLGQAVRQLPATELKRFITVTISHAEYAEQNLFEGPTKQLNIVMDLDGLGLMRLPPLNLLQSIGSLLNRDYAGRGGWMFLINAPVMLGLVISGLQRVILCPSYTEETLLDKGFLEGKERIVILGRRYKASLLLGACVPAAAMIALNAVLDLYNCPDDWSSTEINGAFSTCRYRSLENRCTRLHGPSLVNNLISGVEETTEPELRQLLNARVSISTRSNVQATDRLEHL